MGCHASGDLPDPELNLSLLTTPSLAGGFFTISTTWEGGHIGFPDGISGSGKETACQCQETSDTGLIPVLGKSPGEGNGSIPGHGSILVHGPFQYSCLENPTERSLVGCGP